LKGLRKEFFGPGSHGLNQGIRFASARGQVDFFYRPRCLHGINIFKFLIKIIAYFEDQEIAGPGIGGLLEIKPFYGGNDLFQFLPYFLILGLNPDGNADAGH
jgi:hypothetical protein